MLPDYAAMKKSVILILALLPILAQQRKGPPPQPSIQPTPEEIHQIESKTITIEAAIQKLL